MPYPKVIHVKFTGATTGDPVSVKNLTTGEIVSKDPRRNGVLRLDTNEKAVTFDLNNFTLGWAVGDIITVSIGGTKMGVANITLTASSGAPQTTTVTAAAVSTAVLTI